jgi:hypothetical protein
VAAPADRVRLARSRSLLTRSTVFRTSEGLEEQEIEGYDVSLRRVRYDEVLLVTRHRTTNWIAAIAAFFFFGLCSFWSLLAGLLAQSVPVGVGAFAVTGVPLLVVLILLLSVKVEVVTVFGRRMRIRMRFWLRKSQASQVHDEVCRRVRQRQERDRPVVPPAPRAGDELPLEPTAP